jgi:hypothetical protein
MAKIDFTKVEQQLSIGIHTIFVKDVLEGKSTVSSHAVAYYGLDQGKRPVPRDSVIEGLKELEIDTSKEPQPVKEKVLTSIPTTEKVPVSEDTEEPLSALFLIDQHLRWFRKKKVKDVFTFLGTTEEELQSLREKEKLSTAEQKRTEEILAKAKQAKTIVVKKLGLQEDEILVEKERKKHITKRFNIRETWLPL